LTLHVPDDSKELTMSPGWLLGAGALGGYRGAAADGADRAPHRNAVVPIIQTLADGNDQLSRGRPFFFDIARDGIPLYEEPGHPLAQPKPLDGGGKTGRSKKLL